MRASVVRVHNALQPIKLCFEFLPHIVSHGTGIASVLERRCLLLHPGKGWLNRHGKLVQIPRLRKLTIMPFSVFRTLLTSLVSWTILGAGIYLAYDAYQGLVPVTNELRVVDVPTQTVNAQNPT